MENEMRVLLILLLTLLTIQVRAAETSIICDGKNYTQYPSLHKAVADKYSYVINYEMDGEGNISDFSYRGVGGCDKHIDFKYNDTKLEFSCFSTAIEAVGMDSKKTITIDRMTGKFTTKLKIERGNGDNLAVWDGECRKAKKKF